jgi:hypothetical protein
LETDPVRRTALIEIAMKKAGMDVGALPKSNPQTMQPNQPGGSPAGTPANSAPSAPTRATQLQQPQTATQKVAAAMPSASNSSPMK